MPAPSAPETVRDVNVRYHDAAARHYDEKWGVSFGDVGARQVLGKLRKLLGPAPGPFAHGLEVGAGTGYFSIHLLRAGVLRAATATDISPGMLAALRDNAAEAGVEVETVACDAERLPFPDGSFDLVFGHAVLHHLPGLERAFREFHRVLRPGGAVAFAGEPSRHGDRLAAVPKGLAQRAAPAWRALVRARPAPGGDLPAPHTHEGAEGEELEPFVDVHAFTPDALAAPARAAGFEDVRVRGEELLANWFGWANRTLEASAAYEDIPWLWRQYAFRGYLLLQRVDRVALEPRLPPALFYNLMVSGRRDAGG
jgi:ubiquinone/menaquinone biosynthesis C-methylase UbiE